MQIEKIITGRNSFVFYKSFYEAIQDLPKENQLEVYNLIFEYCFFGKIPKEKNTATAIFKLIKPNIDSNNKKYFANIENGKLGGRPSKTKTQIKPNQNPNKTQSKPNQNPVKPSKTQSKPLMSNELCIMSNELCIMNNEEKEIKEKGYTNFYGNIEKLNKYEEFVYMHQKNYDKLCKKYGEEYTLLAIEKLNIWKLEKHAKKDYKACTGNDYLKICKWVIISVIEDQKKINYEKTKKYLENINKASDPKLIKICEEMIQGGYTTWDSLKKLKKEDILECYPDYLQRKTKGEYT